jgi:hypothetical protein
MNKTPLILAVPVALILLSVSMGQANEQPGDSEADELGLEAVRNSIPFQRPPASMELKDSGVWIEFSFDYNVFRSKHLD